MTIEPAMNSFLDDIASRCGARSVVTDADVIAPWLTDWRGLYRGAAQAMLMPRTTADCAFMVARARDAGVALVPQGGNTSMVGGATPPADGSALILSTRAMTAIRQIDGAAGMAVAEAGVVLQTLHEAAGAAGMRFPLTLGARGSATIGGLVSTNAGGTQVLRFGTMRRLTLGVEAVLPDGSVVDALQPLKKDTTGYDLTQLLIGAEGTLGIVTAATLRLVPLPAATATGWAAVADPQAALALLRHAERVAPGMVESFELMPADAVAASAAAAGVRLPVDAAWHVLLDLAGADADAAMLDTLAPALDAAIATNAGQAAAWWGVRDGMSSAERARGPSIAHDLSVPVAAMPDFLVDTPTALAAAFPGTGAMGFGHLGDGNIHFHVRAPAGAAPDWRATDGAAASRLVHDCVVAAGGSIAAEHGIGQMKRAELLRLSPPAKIAALRAIKAAFDPAGLMNPGKLVPLASDAAPA